MLWGILPSKGVGVDSYPALENVVVFFLKSLIKLEINTVTSLVNFCQWRIFTLNRICCLELHGVCGMSWTRIMFQPVYLFIPSTETFSELASSVSWAEQLCPGAVSELLRGLCAGQCVLGTNKPLPWSLHIPGEPGLWSTKGQGWGRCERCGTAVQPYLVNDFPLGAAPPALQQSLIAGTPPER